MPFEVRHTADFQQDGQLVYQDVGLDILEETGLNHGFVDTFTPEVRSDQLAGIDALVCLSPRVTSASLEGVDRLALIARFGVGFDSVDVDACTDAGILLTITKGAVNHSVAEATVAFMLSLSHNVLIKDRLTREGRWDERSAHMGSELRDRTLGIVGLGGIGSSLAKMVGGFGMKRIIAADPHVSEEQASSIGATLVPLDVLLAEADFVSINCPLNDETRDLIGARELGLMKSTAYLINTARGGIVNESALIDALKQERIAGAALDCHETEPLPAGHPISELDNVILAPHAIAWTNELFRDIGRQTCRQVLQISRGEIPEGVINTAVLDRPAFQARIDRFRENA